MIPKFLRRCAALAAAGTLVAVAAGCGSSLNDAATVTVSDKSGDHVTHITRDEFTNELKQLTGNEKFLKVLADNQSPISSGNSTDPRFSAYWLTQRINQVAYDAGFNARNLKVDDAAHEQAVTAANQNFGGEEVFKAFPKSLQDQIVDGYARAITLAGALTKQPTDAEAEAYFAEHKADFGCASGKDVAHILVADQAKADALMAQLNAGAKFSDLATANSTDSGSAQQGGSLGCLKDGAFVTEFQNAANAAALNTPVGPVKSEFGYHIILVTPAAPVTFASVRDQVVTAIEQARQTDTSAAILGLIKKLDVNVDPRFGSWKRTTTSEGQVTYTVQAPKSPEVRNSRETTTSTTAAANPEVGP